MPGLDPIDELFERRQVMQHNINEHMETLRRYGELVDTIVELGTEAGFSTTAFLAARPYSLDCWDIRRDPGLSEVEAAVPPVTLFHFHEEDSRKADFQSCDLLFIDTLHTFRQLYTELELHGDKAWRFIILHDTEAFAWRDEAPRDSETLPREPSKAEGLQLAIDCWLADRPHWRARQHFKHQNGLTVLERTG